MPQIYTIGHSSHPAEHFLWLLKQYEIAVLVDVRSAPYSRYAPQFNRETLQKQLSAGGVRYLYMGDVIGGRPTNKDHYDEQGHVSYARVRDSEEFLSGIERLERGAVEMRIAVMCAEEGPMHCHRWLLIGQTLEARGNELLHVRGDGRLQTTAELKPDGPQRELFAHLK